MRPIGSTHTGQPGPWIMLHVRAAAGRRVRSARWRACGRRRIPSGGSAGAGRASRAIAAARPRAQLAVAKFVDVFHRCGAPIGRARPRRTAPACAAASSGSSLRQRVADVDDHVVARRDVVDQRERDPLAHAADVDQRRVRTRAARRRARGSRGTCQHASARACSATHACPSARPPSLGGTACASSMARPRAAQAPVRRPRAQDRVEEAAAAAGDRGRRRALPPRGRPTRPSAADQRRMEQRGAEPGVALVGQTRIASGVRSSSLSGAIAIQRAIGAAPRHAARPVLPAASPPGLRTPSAGCTPSSPAAASNQRPMLDVSGALHAAREHRRDRRRRRLVGEAPRDLVAAAAREQRGGRHAPRLARRAIATGQAQRREPAEAFAARAVDMQQARRPTRRRRCPGRRRRARDRAPAPSRDARRRRRRCAHDDAARRAHGTPQRAASRAAWRVLKKSGCRSCATSSGATSRIASRCSTRCRRAHAQVGALSRSPTCCETNASSPRVTQTVFLK